MSLRSALAAVAVILVAVLLMFIGGFGAIMWLTDHRAISASRQQQTSDKDHADDAPAERRVGLGHSAGALGFEV